MFELNNISAVTANGTSLTFNLTNNGLILSAGENQHKVTGFDGDRVLFIAGDKQVGAMLVNKSEVSSVLALFETSKKPGRKLMVLGKNTAWDSQYWADKEKMNLGAYFDREINGEHVYCCYAYQAA